jgi:hypothetical protein
MTKEAFDKIAQGLIDASEGRFECTSPVGAHLADDLVTEEMVEAAREAVFDLSEGEARAVISAVAPLIAAREREMIRASFVPSTGDLCQALVTAEREACAQLADAACEYSVAAAIRARGEP